MNAPIRLSQLTTAAGAGLDLRLRTLTPLYTGGIGQQGDQIHPSNLLGGIRKMSCEVARTLGDAEFEEAVWGRAGSGKDNEAKAKRIALRWDTSALQRVTLPSVVKIPKAGQVPSRWWFNSAYEGELGLRITRREISDAHWQILLIALSIQVRHGSFGAKDQFGLGVLELIGLPTFVQPLDINHNWDKAILEGSGRLNLLRRAFATVQFRAAPGQRPRLSRETALQLGLGTRAALRNALRAPSDASEEERNGLTSLRHRMLGKLNSFGSAVDVSAAYGEQTSPRLRLSVTLKPEQPETRSEVLRAFDSALKRLEGTIEATGYRFDNAQWDFGGRHAKDKAAWLNTLSGV